MGNTIESFRDLRVWQDGMRLVTAVYEITGSFPVREVYGLSSQIRRAAVSIPANIAEGHCREHLKEYLNFLSIAQGSVAELETELEIAGRLKYTEPQVLAGLLAQSTALAKQIRSLRAALGRHKE